MHYVYILQLRDKSYDHGYLSDPKKRLREHENGFIPSPKNLRPVKLIFYAAFSPKRKVLEFEKYLKTSSGFAFRNKRLI